LNESESHNAHQTELSVERLLAEGYLPLLQLAAKYGYAKDHIGRLARQGKVEALRFGTQGEWHVREESLNAYLRTLTDRRLSRTSPIPSAASIAVGAQRPIAFGVVSIVIGLTLASMVWVQV